MEPVVRRFMVAPFEGRLETCLVRPGDLVKDGQALASMDDRELSLELNSTKAEWSRASTKRAQATSQHDTSEAKMAALEMEKSRLKLKMLRNRQKQLTISSPMDGVVLRGDLDDAEGAPVTSGQSLYEIAPLHPIKIEIAINEEDLPSVEKEMQVTARLDGYNGPAIEGAITKIHPRSEIRDSKNVFIAEVELNNEDELLRPGMSGKARITSGYKPLGWIWFHKAWHKARTWMGV